MATPAPRLAADRRVRPAGPAPVRREAPRVVTVGSRRYAAGLLWGTADDDAATDLRTLAITEAKTKGEDLYATRDDIVTQWALGRSAFGHKPGMPVGAAVLADQIEGSWTGVFDLGDGRFWFLAAIDGALEPQGDRLVYDVDEAAALLEAARDRAPRRSVYAPKHWDLDGATAATLDRFFAGRQRLRVRLRPTTHRRLAALAVVAVVFVAGLAMLADAFWSDLAGLFEDEPAPAPAGPAPGPAPVRRARSDGQEAPPPPPPWLQRHAAAPWLQACTATVRRLRFEIGGWQAEPPGCSGRTATMTWQRIDGTIAGAEARIRDRLGPGTQLRYDNQGDKIVISLVLSGIEPGMGPPALRADAIIRQLWTISQGVGERIEVKTAEAPPAPPPMPGVTPTQAPAPPAQILYPSITFATQTALPPTRWARHLDLPGATIDSAAELADGRWRLAGRIYVEGPPAPAATAPAPRKAEQRASPGP